MSELDDMHDYLTDLWQKSQQKCRPIIVDIKLDINGRDILFIKSIPSLLVVLSIFLYLDKDFVLNAMQCLCHRSRVYGIKHRELLKRRLQLVSFS